MEKNLLREYFGGDASNLGIVRRITPNSFKQFVDQQLGLPVSLNVTREQYWAMDHNSRAKAKRVPFVTPATFKALPDDDPIAPHSSGAQRVRRSNANMASISLICLDLDDPASASPYYNHPEILEDHLHPFGFALYRTASSTPENPRLRLMVDVHDLPVDRYPDAVRDIAVRIGLPDSALTPESIKPAMPMFLPTIFADEDDTGQGDHPLLFTATTTREPYTLRSLEESEYAVLGEPAQESAKFKSNPMAVGVDPLEQLDYLKAPLEGCELEDVRKALEYVDPDCTYPEWVNVVAGLKHQFQKSQGEEAFVVFDEWSARGDKYASAGETRAKWDSFYSTPRGRLPVTIRSILKRAADNGWASNVLTDKCFQAVHEWMESGRESGVPENRWLGAAMAKVAAIPLLSHAEEETLLRRMLFNANTHFGMKVGIAALRKDLKAVRDKERKRTYEKKNKDKRPKWTLNLVFIESLDMFYRTKTRMFYSPSAIDKAYGRELLSLSDDDQTADSIVANSKPKVRPMDYLLNVLQIPSAYSVVYDPTTSETLIKYPKLGYQNVNTYVSNYPEPDPSQAEYAKKVFEEHMEKLIKEPRYRTLFLDFLSYMVQERGGKVRWAILLQGAQGCGKTFILEAMKAVLGDGHAGSVGPEAVKSEFNEWAHGKRLVALEEIRVAGHNRHDVMNKLKQLISNESVSISQKFQDAREEANYTSYLLFTNHHDAIVLTDDDRRYMVIKSRQQSVADVEAMGGDEYFERLFGMLKTHAAGLRHYFENRPISPDFNANGHAPRTTYAQDLIREQIPPVNRMLAEAIEDHEDGNGPALIRDEVVSTKALSDYAEVNGVRAEARCMSKALTESGYIHAGRSMLSDGIRHSLWVKTGQVNGKPPEDTAKELAEMALGGELDYSELL